MNKINAIFWGSINIGYFFDYFFDMQMCSPCLCLSEILIKDYFVYTVLTEDTRTTMSENLTVHASKSFFLQ